MWEYYKEDFDRELFNLQTKYDYISSSTEEDVDEVLDFYRENKDKFTPDLIRVIKNIFEKIAEVFNL